MLRVGIVGLPNVGKSTLFNALTCSGVAAENYPFCTVDPNVGVVEVPDERVRKIQELAGSRESVPSFIRFVDIAGLVRGASTGEGLGNQFLGQIREVDAIAHVLRCFHDPDVAHVLGSIDPVRDMEIIDTELALADLETVERRREKVGKKARSGEQDAIREMNILERIFPPLEEGVPLRDIKLSSQERTLGQALNLLTLKPVFHIANVGEKGVGQEAGALFSSLGAEMPDEGGSVAIVPISLAIEAELALLEPGERREFLKDLGLSEQGSVRVIREAYRILGLISFFTANEKQTTAWAVPRGTTASEAAGVIHTDFQRGFIRAEAIGFQEFAEAGSMKAARDKGAIRSEGKDYVVSDGDILLFRFNV